MKLLDTNLLIFCICTLSPWINEATGQCILVWTSGAIQHTHINGQYQLTSEMCNGWNTWQQIIPPNVDHTSYISYEDHTGSWLIGATICDVQADAKGEGYVRYPYDLKKGDWSELNATNIQWVPNTNLYVYCDPAGGMAGVSRMSSNLQLAIFGAALYYILSLETL